MPLMPDNDSNFRLFLGDIGMFSYQSGINAASFISNKRENTLSGIFFENFVANELIAREHKLFYWRGKAFLLYSVCGGQHGRRNDEKLNLHGYSGLHIVLYKMT